MSFVELVAFRQHLVEIVLAEHRAQRRLGELARRHHEILDLDRRLFGIDDPEINHRADANRDVVMRNDVLAGHIEHARAQVDPHHLLHVGNEQEQSGSLDAGEAAKRENNAPLVLPQDLDRGRDDDAAR